MKKSKDHIKLLEPKGKLTIRTTTMPADTNYRGDIFGGWIMSQMDLAGGIAAVEITKSRLTTVAVNSMRFWNPVHVGDIVCIYAELTRIGNTSISFLLNVWAVDRFDEEKRHLVTEAEFIYVSIDENSKPIHIRKKQIL